MFGRGSWAIVGLDKESLEAFKTNLGNRGVMAAHSQMAALAVTRQFSADAIGINPFGAPRLDEQHPLPLEHHEALARYANLDEESDARGTLPEAVLACEGYAHGVERFQVHAVLPWFGLWAVSNEWKDVSDLASVKEHRSYEMMERPYKFLQASDKKSVDQETLGATASVRKQVPVLLDFHEGRVYIESGNKKLIYAITVRLTLLGAKIIPVAWTFDARNWTSAVLNQLYEGTQYRDEFRKRADEATRFKPSEIEKHEDRELESIVSNFFSMTQLPSEMWIGISGPTHIRLHDASPPLSVKAATSATTLLYMTSDAVIVSGAITFQERISYLDKNGGERSFRKDLFSIDVNDRINLTDAGAAMLRGFDLPTFRKDILREIRQTKQVPPIDQFWGNWMHEMSKSVRMIESSFRELLSLNGNQAAGILPMRTAEEEEEE